MKIKFLNEAVDKDTGHIDPSPKDEAEVKDLKDKEIQPIATPEEAAARASIQSNKDNADKAIKSSNNTKNGEDLAKELGGDRTKAPKTPAMKPYTEGLEDDNDMTLDDYFNKDKRVDDNIPLSFMSGSKKESFKIKDRKVSDNRLNEWLVGTRGFLTELKMVIKDDGGINKKEYDSAEDWANVIWYDDPYNVTIPKAWCAEYGVDYENLTEEALDDYWEQEIWGEHQAEIKALYDGAASLTESKKSSLKIKDRKELAQHIIEARKNNKKWKISRCLEEGYRYLFEEEDGEVRITNDLEWEALADKISKNISNRVYELEDNLATSLVSEVPGYNNEWCANDSNIDCIEDLNKSREQFIHDITTCMLINSDWTKHINEAKKNNKNTPTNEKLDSCESGESRDNSSSLQESKNENNINASITNMKDAIDDAYNVFGSGDAMDDTDPAGKILHDNGAWDGDEDEAGDEGFFYNMSDQQIIKCYQDFRNFILARLGEDEGSVMEASRIRRVDFDDLLAEFKIKEITTYESLDEASKKESREVDLLSQLKDDDIFKGLSEDTLKKIVRIYGQDATARGAKQKATDIDIIDFIKDGGGFGPFVLHFDDPDYQGGLDAKTIRELVKKDSDLLQACKDYAKENKILAPIGNDTKGIKPTDDNIIDQVFGVKDKVLKATLKDLEERFKKIQTEKKKKLNSSLTPTTDKPVLKEDEEGDDKEVEAPTTEVPHEDVTPVEDDKPEAGLALPPEEQEINVDDLASYKPTEDEAPAFTSIKDAGEGTMAAFEDTLKDLYDVQIKLSQLHDLLTKDAAWTLDMLGIGDTKKPVPEPVIADTKADSAIPAEASFGDEEPVVDDKPVEECLKPEAPKPVAPAVPTLDDGEPVPVDVPEDDPEAERAALAAKMKAAGLTK